MQLPPANWFAPPAKWFPRSQTRTGCGLVETVPTLLESFLFGRVVGQDGTTTTLGILPWGTWLHNSTRWVSRCCEFEGVSDEWMGTRFSTCHAPVARTI